MPSTFKLVLPTLFGNERALANELERGGYRKGQFVIDDGRVVLTPDPGRAVADLARLNVGSRIAERVLLSLSEGVCRDFDTLFEMTTGIPWHLFAPRGAEVRVTGFSHDSDLSSVPACQRVISRAIYGTLATAYGLDADARLRIRPEAGELHVQFSLKDNRLRLMLDTSGLPLHKRGYRAGVQHEAPLRETTAAALLDYAHLANGLRFGGVVVDLFTGSGTLAIEAALMAAGLAPGHNRSFAAERLPGVPPTLFCEEKTREPQPLPRPDACRDTPPVLAIDRDPASLELAKRHARRAGVSHLIRFECADATEIDTTWLQATLPAREYLLVGNPPYGERLDDRAVAAALYRALGARYLPALRRNKPKLSLALITDSKTFEREFGQKARKRRKLYNGPLACTLYSYF